MNRISLNNSGVLFFDFDHSYISRENKPLEGITTMLKKQLFPNMYSDVPEYILKAKAEWGTERHKEMQQFVNAVLDNDSKNVRELEQTFDICCRFNEDCRMSVYEPHKNERDMCSYLAAEYSVTDFKNHASQIDLVMQVGENEVILIDYKTYSDFDNSKKAYVRWQLSLYRYMFELVNPEVKVVGAYAYLYTKKGEHYFWDCETFVEREECEKLIACEDNGEQYISPFPTAPNIITDLAKDKVDEIVKFLELSAQVEEMKKRLNENTIAFMESMRAKEIVNDRFKVTYVAPSKRTSVDTKLLQSRYPDIYKELLKESSVKSSVKFKLI